MSRGRDGWWSFLKSRSSGEIASMAGLSVPLLSDMRWGGQRRAAQMGAALSLDRINLVIIDLRADRV